MKISKWVDMGQEVSVEIGLEDIRAALGEAFANVERNDFDARPNKHDVLYALNSIATFLRALTDEQIAMLNDGERKIISEFLRTQSERYYTEGFHP